MLIPQPRFRVGDRVVVPGPVPFLNHPATGHTVAGIIARHTMRNGKAIDLTIGELRDIGLRYGLTSDEVMDTVVELLQKRHATTCNSSAGLLGTYITLTDAGKEAHHFVA